MNTKTSKMIVSALVAGLVASSSALAQPGQDPDNAGVTVAANDNGCKGEGGCNGKNNECSSKSKKSKEKQPMDKQETSKTKTQDGQTTTEENSEVKSETSETK